VPYELDENGRAFLTSCSRVPPTQHTHSSSTGFDIYRYYMRSFRSPLVPSALTPSRTPSNAAIPSSTRKNRGELFLIAFPLGWGHGNIFDWVRNRNTSVIKGIELRKEYDPFQHEYILLILQDDCFLRIDRRPKPDVPIDSLMRRGSPAVDTIQEVASRDDLAESRRIIDIRFGPEAHFNIYDLLYICYSVHLDEEARYYTLQRYNCYFLSWTIALLVLRSVVDRISVPRVAGPEEEIFQAVESWHVHGLWAEVELLKRAKSMSEERLRVLAETIKSDMIDRTARTLNRYKGKPLFLRNCSALWENETMGDLSRIGTVMMDVVERISYGFEGPLTRHLLKASIILACMKEQISVWPRAKSMANTLSGRLMDAFKSHLVMWHFSLLPSQASAPFNNEVTVSRQHLVSNDFSYLRNSS
jgi:hypothetical protein